MNQSFKHCYPFRLATTSFIYPDSYCANVARLGALVDEIELLIFESGHLPDRSEINELKQMARSLDITYNVHLPLDIEMGHHEQAIRQQSVRLLAMAIERVAPLDPTTHTLHLTLNTTNGQNNPVEWQQRSMESVSQLLETTAIAPEMISVETLDFAPSLLEPICHQLNLAFCVDIGHVIRYGFDLPMVLQSFGSKISIFHLHGVANGKDHLSLDQLDGSSQETILSHLKNFTGSVSLEVFSEADLKNSLSCLAELMSISGRTLENL